MYLTSTLRPRFWPFLVRPVWYEAAHSVNFKQWRQSISHRLAPVSRPLLKVLQIRQNTICSVSASECKVMTKAPGRGGSSVLLVEDKQMQFIQSDKLYFHENFHLAAGGLVGWQIRHCLAMSSESSTVQIIEWPRHWQILPKLIWIPLQKLWLRPDILWSRHYVSNEHMSCHPSNIVWYRDSFRMSIKMIKKSVCGLVHLVTGNR